MQNSDEVRDAVRARSVSKAPEDSALQDADALFKDLKCERRRLQVVESCWLRVEVGLQRKETHSGRWGNAESHWQGEKARGLEVRDTADWKSALRGR